MFMDAVAPGLLLAQGDRPHRQLVEPGALRQADRPAVGAQDRPRPPAARSTSAYPTFHPTFLYELIWDVVGVLLLLWIGRRFTINPPNLFALYVAWYCFGRFFEELLRIDPAHHIAGLRLNAWVSIVVFVGSVAYFVLHERRARGRGQEPKRREPPKPAQTMAIPKGRVR